MRRGSSVMTPYNVGGEISEVVQFGSVVGEEYSGGTSGPPTECRGLNPGKNPLAGCIYPLKTLPSKFRLHHLVEIDLRYSKLESLWDDTLIFRNLHRLDVTGSKNLIQLPNLSTAKNFEELIVEGCKSLQKIPESLKRLFKLKKLNASHCDSLKSILSNVDSFKSEYTWLVLLSFPYEKSSMVYLKDLSIDGQIHVKVLSLYGFAEHISFRSKQPIPDELLMMEESTSHQLMSDSKGLHSLNIMNFRYRESNVPFACIDFVGFKSVKELKLVNLNIEEIPDGIISCRNLEKLDLSGNNFVSLPYTMDPTPWDYCAS
ncbi:hypothetical protein HID58_072182 [Brassica napus]|uniref:Disease resistance protein n=1 Tax=Brassica napus TaxID=3708 RepID=A0ABQ7Z3N2_BRANA|nr:hypothetical protein HID58_072182 [Brassica napus]